LWFFVVFAAVYLLAVWTGIGQSAENALIVGRADQARIFGWRQSVPPLTRGTAVLAAGVLLIIAVTLMRRCWREGVAALAIVVVTFGATEALHAVLPRPGLSPAPQALSGASFPSGTVAIAAGLALGVAVVSSPRARPYVAAAGAIWLAVIAAAVQTLYWHRPSDVLGATLLACTCHATATGLLAPVGVRRLRALPPLALPRQEHCWQAHGRSPLYAHWCSRARRSCARHCSGSPRLACPYGLRGDGAYHSARRPLCDDELV